MLFYHIVKEVIIALALDQIARYQAKYIEKVIFVANYLTNQNKGNL